MSDRVFGVVGLLFGLFVIFAATQVQLGFIVDPLGPRTFPIILGSILALASLYPILRPDPEPDWPGAWRLLEIGAAVAALIAYALLLPELGFIIATALAAAYLTWRLGSSLVETLIAGPAISIGIYVVFRLALGLSLAEGPWGF